MKQVFSIFAFILLIANALAQVPQKINYQAVIRNNNSVLIANKQIGMRISILKGSANGTPVYVETHNPITNINGLINIEIGTGTILSGKFDNINWADDAYFIKTEIDPNNGISYTITVTNQLLSVPYALLAKQAEQANEIDPIFSSSPAKNITNADIERWNSLNNPSGIPVGIILPYAGSSAPNGYLICDGSAISRSTYASLFAVIGTTYGNGDGSTTFNLPDLRGRIPVGLHNTGTFNSLGSTGGSETHVISIDELPPHNHTATISTAGEHTHTGTTTNNGNHNHNYTRTVVTGGASTTLPGGNTNTVITRVNYNETYTTQNSGNHNHNLEINNAGSHTHNITIDNIGNGKPISVLQPYIVLNYIIKY